MNLKYFALYLITKYERLSCRDQRLRLILRAKEIYLFRTITYRNKVAGLCSAFETALEQEHIMKPVDNIIPEFNPTYLNAECKRVCAYWWKVKDVTSRLSALNKLIALYKIKAIRID